MRVWLGGAGVVEQVAAAVVVTDAACASREMVVPALVGAPETMLIIMLESSIIGEWIMMKE